MRYSWQLRNTEANFDGLETYHPLINKLLAKLNLKQAEIDKFLNPSLSDLPNTDSLSEIDQAVVAITKYKDSKHKIIIHGDYDTDGIVATSILWDFLYRKLLINCVPVIPNRFEDGYGLSENTIAKAKAQGGKLIITVDCGIKDIELIRKHPELQFIITDHHAFPTNDAGEPVVPKADNLIAVIHPQHPEYKYPFKEICGANVAWKLIIALTKKLKLKFDPNTYLPLVALATVTDVMPLTGENRIIVKKGVEQMKDFKNIGFETLLETISLDKSQIQTYHLGYVIGPNFNATGRMKDAIDGVRLLSTEDKTKSRILAKTINELNQQRQQLSESLFQTASETKLDSPKVIIAYGDKWPEGVIGLIAGKLCERYHKPSIVMSIDNHKKTIKGSARSIGKFNITEALAACSMYLDRYGGHKQAAGFSVKFEYLTEFIETFKDYVTQNLDSADLIPKLEIDAKLMPEDISIELVKTIEALEPFGNANSKPKFLIEHYEIIENKIIGNGEKHYKLILSKNGNNLTAIAFNKKELIEKIKPGDIIDVVGCPSTNKWNGREYLQFEIIDLKKIK